MHSTFDRMPVTHARQITGRYGDDHKPMTADEWLAYGGFPEDFPQLMQEANAILDAVTPEQEELLKRAVHDRSIDMNALQCKIRDQVQLEAPDDSVMGYTMGEDNRRPRDR
jgi:hypothetical protein